tara:strand:+ start:3277 stop:3663 length:387 start_codon:yes stop_codon:yes gene_type:complete
MNRLATLDLTRLTAKQAKLVDTLVATGCSIKEASQVAGYAKGESGRVSASKALKSPHVQAYMMQQVTESIGLNATKASRKLMELSEGARSEYVQLEASKDILDRAGFKTPDRHQHQLLGDLKVSIQLD